MLSKNEGSRPQQHDVFSMNLVKLDSELKSKSRELKQKESHYEYHMALVKTAPYTLTSLIVASVWAVLYHQPLAGIPIAIGLILAGLALYSRWRINTLAETISTLGIQIGQINARIQGRETYVMVGYQDSLQDIRNRFSRSWDMVEFSDYMDDKHWISQNWSERIPPMIKEDMRYRHKELFSLMESLDVKSQEFWKAANDFRRKAKAIVESPKYALGVDLSRNPEWAAQRIKGLLLSIVRKVETLDSLIREWKLGNLDTREKQIIELMFKEDNPGHWLDALRDKDLVTLADEAEKKRVEAESTHVQIREEIEGLYSRSRDAQFSIGVR